MNNNLASSDLSASTAPESVRPGQEPVISRWMAEEYHMLPSDAVALLTFSRKDNSLLVMNCFERTDGTFRRIDNFAAWVPSEEFYLARRIRISEEAKPPYEQVLDVLAGRLLSAFLTYRYDVDVKPEELYSSNDKEALLQQIRWNIRKFVKPLLVGRSQPDGSPNSTEAKT
jgi:hypothetical protein